MLDDLDSVASLVLRLLKSKKSIMAHTTVSLIFCAAFVSFCIYIWKVLGCMGFSNSYLCRKFMPEEFLNYDSFNSTTNDFNQLIDLTNFSFVINHKNCENDDLLLLVLVHSKPKNFEKRLTIRSTWGGISSERLKVLFLFGIPNSHIVQAALEKENDWYEDIVQGNFLDTYRNLTYKHIMAFKWAKYFCPQAKYILKTDDDVFINSPNFLNYLNTRENLSPGLHLLRCIPVHGGKVQRSNRSKWKVTYSEYKFHKYPTYCHGFAVLYSFNVALDLYHKAQYMNYFWIDDVFVTGILASFTTYQITTFGTFALRYEDLGAVVQGLTDSPLTFLLGPYNLNEKEIEILWEKCQSDCV